MSKQRDSGCFVVYRILVDSRPSTIGKTIGKLPAYASVRSMPEYNRHTQTVNPIVVVAVQVVKRDDY